MGPLKIRTTAETESFKNMDDNSRHTCTSTQCIYTCRPRHCPLFIAFAFQQKKKRPTVKGPLQPSHPPSGPKCPRWKCFSCHLHGASLRKCQSDLLPQQQPPPLEEEEDPDCVQEHSPPVGKLSSYVPVMRDLILFHQKAPSNQVMEVLVQPPYLRLFPLSITLI